MMPCRGQQWFTDNKETDDKLNDLFFLNRDENKLSRSRPRNGGGPLTAAGKNAGGEWGSNGIMMSFDNR